MSHEKGSLQSLSTIVGQILEQLPGNGLYTRSSKSAGTTLDALLKEVLPDIAVAGEAMNDNDALRQAKMARNETFIIATVRNPCEWYVSWWTMFMRVMNESGGKEGCMLGKEESYCKDASFRECVASFAPDNIDLASPTEDETKGFQRWVSSPRGWQNRVSLNFWAKHGKLRHHEPWFCPVDSSSKTPMLDEQVNDFTPESIADCWIHTENLHEDTTRCINLYEKSGGKINWDKLPKLIGNRNPRPEARLCSKFFDDKTAKFVMEHDKSLFQLFGYSKCCEA